MNTLKMGKRGRKKTIIEKRITNTFDDKAGGDLIEDSNSAFPREIKIFKTPLKGLAPRDPSDPVFIAAQRALVSVGMGRAAARPEIWPTGRVFLLARPDPGRILGSPT